MKPFRITLLAVALSALLSSPASGQFFDLPTYKVDMEYIREMASDTAYYNHLIKLFETDSEKLTPEDVQVIYYGYSTKPGYAPYATTTSEVRNLMQQERYSEAYDLAKAILKSNPVTLEGLYLAAFLEAQTRDDAVGRTPYVRRYATLLMAIYVSGDGKSPDSAFWVISVPDEYEVLRNLLQVEILDRVSTHGDPGYFDIFTVVPNETYGPEDKVYFDFSIPATIVRQMIEAGIDEQADTPKEKRTKTKREKKRDRKRK